MKTYLIKFSDESLIALKAATSREADLLATAMANSEGSKRYVIEITELKGGIS